MFTSFFYLLRSNGLDVSLNEWLTLMEALDQGLADTSLTKFYHLSRAILVKSEADFDKFDESFLEFYRDATFTGKLPDELLAWLETPKHTKESIDYERAEENAKLSYEEIFRMLRERLAEQTSEHNGGSYWVGTHGVSVFGNDGYSPRGIRVGGVSQHRSAIEIAGQRKYRDFRTDATLDIRNFQMALRSLRQYSQRIDAERTELNIDESIRKTGEQAGRLELVFDKPRKNTIKLLLLMDSGGSMDEYSELCTSLFQAVSKSNHFKDLKVYYFHNCIKRYLYTTPGIHYDEKILTEWALRNLDADYRVLLVGDAMMAPHELTMTHSYSTDEPQPSSMEWMTRIRDHFHSAVWLTPENINMWQDHHWGYTIRMVGQIFEMQQLTLQGLETAVKKLLMPK